MCYVYLYFVVPLSMSSRICFSKLVHKQTHNLAVASAFHHRLIGLELLFGAFLELPYLHFQFYGLTITGDNSTPESQILDFYPILHLNSSLSDTVPICPYWEGCWRNLSRNEIPITHFSIENQTCKLIQFSSKKKLI